MHFHLEAKLRPESFCDTPSSNNFVLKSAKQLVQECYSLLKDEYLPFYLPIHFPLLEYEYFPFYLAIRFPLLEGGLGFSL